MMPLLSDRVLHLEQRVTRELGSDACEEIRPGDTWIITTTSAPHRALAVDPRDGALRWQVAF